DNPQTDVTDGGRLLNRVGLWQRRPGKRPASRKRAPDLGDRGATDLDAGVAPRRDVALRVAEPHVANAQSRHEPDGSIDDQCLAVIARYPTERAREPRRVVRTHLDPRLAQRRPEPAPGLPESAQPVVNDSHTHPLACPCREHLSKLLPNRIVPNEVVLEMNIVRCRSDRLEPRGIVLSTVLEQSHLIAADERRTGGTGKHPISELAKLRQRGSLVRFHPRPAAHLTSAASALGARASSRCPRRTSIGIARIRTRARTLVLQV